VCLPDRTRAGLGGCRSVYGGVRRNYGGKALTSGGEAVRRYADGWLIFPIVRLRVDNVNVLEAGLGELKCSERIEKRRGHGIPLGIDIIRVVFKATVKGEVPGRRTVGSRVSRRRVFGISGSLDETCQC